MLKAKKCSQEGCEAPCWSKDFCKSHSLPKHTTLIRDTPLSKRKGFRKQSEKFREKAIERKQYGEDMMAFFLEIWGEREHVCYETGTYLGEEPNTMFFHHLLFKSKYPEYCFLKENIVLLLPDIHAQMHTDPSKCPKTLQLLNQVTDALIIL